MRTWDEIIEEMDPVRRVEVQAVREKARIVSALIVAREARGWTQAELAARTGMKQSAIARFEGATTAPSIETILKIALALGYRFELTGTSQEEAASSEHEYALS